MPGELWLLLVVVVGFPALCAGFKLLELWLRRRHRLRDLRVERPLLYAERFGEGPGGWIMAGSPCSRLLLPYPAVCSGHVFTGVGLRHCCWRLPAGGFARLYGNLRDGRCSGVRVSFRPWPVRVYQASARVLRAVRCFHAHGRVVVAGESHCGGYSVQWGDCCFIVGGGSSALFPCVRRVHAACPLAFVSGRLVTEPGAC